MPLRLWFAFKLYLWRIEKQPFDVWRHIIKCCDLLSNCIFDVLKNNCFTFSYVPILVVICFQIVSLTYWKTTYPPVRPSWPPLWFAFKLYLWRIEKQLTFYEIEMLASCDLLSNCIFDVLKNNLFAVSSNQRMVVICFQIVSLTYWKTTELFNETLCETLWFAFKLYLWRIEKQLLR